jgi:hypothetical protein
MKSDATPAVVRVKEEPRAVVTAAFVVPGSTISA